MWLIYSIIGIILIFIVVNIAIIIVRLCQKVIPDKPDNMNNSTVSVTKEDDDDFKNLYLSLKSNNPPTEDEILRIITKNTNFINARYDCADFRLQLLFRIYKDCNENLPLKARQLIKETFLNFKYSMLEPGFDSMCMWSENHQLLFAVSEYLAGQEWQDEIFTNAHMTGKEHMERAITFIEAWMSQRFNYGFSEYLSNNYLLENVGPMSNYISYSNDRNTVEKMKIIMDLLWFDVALNSVNNRFVAASSRMYGNNKACNHLGNSLISCTNKLWGKEIIKLLIDDNTLSCQEKMQLKNSLKKQDNSMSVNFTALLESGKYTLPKAIKEIAISNEELVIKMSEGLSPDDLEKENLIGQEYPQIMAQWGAETFTNPQVIKNTVQFMKNHKLYKNAFIYYFKFLDIPLFKLINLQKFCKKFNLRTHGIALGRGNIYTYRNKYYSMTTLINKDVDMCGAQEHIWSANIAENLALFTTHPARDDENGYGASSGYWIGNGRRPMSVQNKNVNISIYKIPRKKRLLEAKISDITHVYFPKCFYDKVEHKGNIIFAQKEKVLIAVISNGEMQFKPFSKSCVEPLYKSEGIDAQEKMYQINGEFDLCRTGGEYHSYVTELSDIDTETFEEFCKRVENNHLEFDGEKVIYCSEGTEINVTYSGSYLVNGKKTENCENRYDCKFCKASRKSEEINIESYNFTLMLNYNKAIRKEGKMSKVI